MFMYVCMLTSVGLQNVHVCVDLVLTSGIIFLDFFLTVILRWDLLTDLRA